MDLTLQAVVPTTTLISEWKPLPLMVNKTPEVGPEMGEILLTTRETGMVLAIPLNKALPFPGTLTTIGASNAG